MKNSCLEDRKISRQIPGTLPRQKVDATGYMLDKEAGAGRHCFGDGKFEDIPYEFRTNQPHQEFGKNMKLVFWNLARIFNL